MRVAIYSPYLEVCGGGEKYIGHIAEVLSRKNKVEFIVFEKPSLDKLKKRLNVDLSRVEFNTLNKFNPPAWMSRSNFSNYVNAYRISRATKKYDLFINQEHFTVIRSLAKTSILMCEVPPTATNTKKNLSPVGRSVRAQLFNKILLSAFFDPKLKSYHKILANSFFTKKWAQQWYNKNVEVLYPPIDTESILPLNKRYIILNVGRFSVGAHCKNQLETIRVFKEMFEKNRTLLEDWEYHLVGEVTSDVGNVDYLHACIKEALGYPIKFHVNASFQTLKELFGVSRILIHATGMNEDQSKYPDLMEHFGIAVVEAMSAGCVPTVIKKGGLPEIISDGVDGYQWSSENELKQKILMLIKDEELWRRMSRKSIEKSQEFSFEKFQKRLKHFLGGTL